MLKAGHHKGGDGWIFCHLDGNPLRKSNFTRRVWHPLRTAAKLPATFHFHDLRHTMASLHVAAGTTVVELAQMMGHASPAVTMEVYAHLLSGTQRPTANKLTDLVQANKPKAETA